MRLRLNPSTGKLDVVDKVDTSDQAFQVIIDADVEASAQPYDVVYQSLTVDDKLEVNIDNTQIQPSIGIIISKPTATTARVLVLGDLDGFTGLTRGKPIYLGINGEVTTTVPTVDYQQALGFARSGTKIFLNPDYRRVKKI